MSIKILPSVRLYAHKTSCQRVRTTALVPELPTRCRAQTRNVNAMRPIKDPDAKRTEKPGVLYISPEIVQLEKNAAATGMSVSDWTRHLRINAKPQRRQATPERQTLIKALGELGHIRAYINQLVKDRQAHHFVKPEDAEAGFKAHNLKVVS